jgi:YD repeat-containing protein
MVRVGSTVRYYDNNKRLLASGIKRGDVLNLHVVDGTSLKINYRTRGIYDQHGRLVGRAHPDNLR